MFLKQLPLLLVASMTPACLSMGMYRTAHILPKGEGDFGMGVSVVRVQSDAYTTTTDGVEVHQDSETVSYPNLIPEVSYHFGVDDNLEVGGRVALGAGMVEVDAKYRFLGGPGESLHLAVQPAVGYQGLLIEGVHGTLPLILTADLNDRVSFNASVFGTYAHYAASDEDADVDFKGDLWMGGGAIGLQFVSDSGFHVMPALELQRTLSRSGDLDGEGNLTFMMFGVTFGWGPSKQLNRIEQKIDQIDQKIDKLTPTSSPDGQL